MSTLPTTLENIRAHDGPAMGELTDKQRAFVIALLENGGNKTRAAMEAYGYATDSARSAGYQISRNAKVIKALKEEADRRVRVEAVLAIQTMVDIMNDPTHKDRFRAAVEIANRSGLQVIQQHEVIHHNADAPEMIRRIEVLAKNLGIDSRKLLGSAGVVTDAEFTEVDNVEVLKSEPSKNEDVIEPDPFSWSPS